MKLLSAIPTRLTNLSVSVFRKVEVREERPPGLDLGSGQMLKAEDVIDGHVHRLLSIDGSPDEGYEKRKQDLTGVIGSLAPHLLPYVHLTNELAEVKRPVAPSSQYRQLLQNALLSERRQLANKRAIGIEPNFDSNAMVHQALVSRTALSAGMLLLATCAICYLYLRCCRTPEDGPIEIRKKYEQ